MDLISREEALGEIKARFEDAREWYRTAKDEDIKARAEAAIMSFTECSLMLKRLPSAERKGRWESDGHTIACSNCHLINLYGRAWEYCPYCGTRMVSEE